MAVKALRSLINLRSICTTWKGLAAYQSINSLFSALLRPFQDEVSQDLFLLKICLIVL